MTTHQTSKHNLTRAAKALLLLVLIALTAATAQAQSHFYNYYTNISCDQPLSYGTLDLDFWGIANGADGSAQRPYLITTTEDLDYLAFRVNEMGDTFYDTYFKLGNDIAYDPDNLTLDHDGDGTNESNYTAIGYYLSSSDDGKWFGGHFDGDGHTISGIRLIGSSDCQGVFGFISGNETSLPEMKNLTLDNAVISGADGVAYVGGIVGSNGFLENYRSGTIENCLVTNTFVSGVNTVGGIVGFNCNDGTIENCHVTNTVAIQDINSIGNNYDYGGIVGLNRGDISHCTSAATFTSNTDIDLLHAIGGIAGSNISSGTVSYCASTATFTFGTDISQLSNVGGIVGVNRGTISYCTSAVSYTFGTNIQILLGIGGIAGVTGVNNTGTGIVSHCLTVGLAIPDAIANDQEVKGAIVGRIMGEAILDHNYYADCNIGGETTNIGYSYIIDDEFNSIIGDYIENDGAVPLGVLLQDDGTGNPETIAAHLNQPNNIGIYGRTLYKDGKWNSLCLPFGLEDFAGTPLEGADVCALESATLADGVVTLNFGEPLTAITAGMPYLVRWAAGGDDLYSPVFSGVTITAAEPTTVSLLDGSVAFMGNYVPFAEPAGLLLDAHNANNGAFHAALQVPEGCEVAYHFPSTCIDPEGFGADLVTATTAELGWDIPMPMEGYTVRYRTAGVQPVFDKNITDWTLCGNTTNSYIHAATTTYGEEYALFWYDINPSNGAAYLISPPLTGHTEDMTLEFKYYTTNESNISATFQVGFSSTDADPDSFAFGEETTITWISDGGKRLYSVPIPAGTKHLCVKVVEVRYGLFFIEDTKAGRYHPAGMAGDPVFSEGFENGIGGWTLRDCVGGTGVQYSTDYTGNATHSGFGIFHFVGRSNYGQDYSDQYLITPMLEGVGESTMLEFYVKKYGCTFQIGFSSTDAETASFTFGEETTIPYENSWSWERYSTPVPAGTKYICWRQVSDVINLDDILVYHELWETVDVAGSGAHVATTIDGTHVSATLEGLTPGTDYDVQVKSDCDEAEWSEMLNITTPDFEADGDIYTIYTADGWNAFCDALQYNGVYNRFIGKTVRLGADISVTRMAGGSGHEFMGTFDGQEHTLTVSYQNNDGTVRTAPFSYIDGATIQNLIVAGNITGTASRAAGIVGETGSSLSHVTNCVSSVNVSGGSYTGGISVGGKVEITGCVFNGTIVGTDKSGGFVGWSTSSLVISNSLFAPQEGSTINGGTFYYNGGGEITPVNSYYTVLLGAEQGYPAVSDPNILPAGDPTGTYPVSDLTAYANGLQYGEVFYYNPESVVTQTVALVEGWNWVSFNVEITLADLEAALVEALPSATNITIKSKENGSTTYNGTRWRGTLNSLDITQMYMVNVHTGCEITLVGAPIVPAEHPITIMNGANWIGYPLTESMSLTNAFAGFAISGDQVKSKDNGSSTYTNRWRGTLTTLEPGQGYIFKSSAQSNRTLVFPTSAK